METLLPDSSPIKIGGRLKFLPEEVAYFQGSINYTHVFLHSKEQFIVATTLKKIEQLFAETVYFIRPCKSFLININFIQAFNENEIFLNNATKVLVSRRKRPFIHKKLSAACA